MRKPNLCKAAAALALLASLLCSHAPAQRARRPARAGARAVLWRDPGPVSARDLRYGPGSASLAPVPPFTFVEEDKGGESPKFDVRDARGVRWGVKLGPEA